MASTFKRFVHRSCAVIVVDELDAGRLKRVPNPVSQAASKFALPDSGEIGSIVSLFSVRPPRLSKPDTLAAAILLNECYSLSLKRSLDGLNCIYGNLPSIFFKVDDRR